MKNRRFKIKKITSGDYAHCWFCSAHTYYALYDALEESEVWCCVECAKKKARMYPNSFFRKKTILKLTSPLKKKGFIKRGVTLC